MVATRPGRGQVGVVGGRWVGDRPLASRVDVAQVVGQRLEVVGWHVEVIPELVVTGRFRGTLRKKSFVNFQKD